MKINCNNCKSVDFLTSLNIFKNSKYRNYAFPLQNVSHPMSLMYSYGLLPLYLQSMIQHPKNYNQRSKIPTIYHALVPTRSGPTETEKFCDVIVYENVQITICVWQGSRSWYDLVTKKVEMSMGSSIHKIYFSDTFH